MKDEEKKFYHITVQINVAGTGIRAHSFCVVPCELKSGINYIIKKLERLRDRVPDDFIYDDY